MRKVAITGRGVVSPIGNSLPTFWDGLVMGRSGVGRVTRFDATVFACQLAVEIEDLDNWSGPHRFEGRRMDCFVRYAVAAARSAIIDSGLSEDEVRSGGAVFVGLGMGGLPRVEEGVMQQATLGPRKISPYLIPSLIPNMAAGMVCVELDFCGPQYTFAAACSGGTQALGAAMHAVRTGAFDWIIAGRTEAVITPITFSGFEAMKALSRSSKAGTPRPFDRERDGMIVGEGAGFFVLESRSHAEARGARIHGVVARSASSASRCMGAALEDGGMTPADIDGIFASGTGLPQDDRELDAIMDAFADLDRPPARNVDRGAHRTLVRRERRSEPPCRTRRAGPPGDTADAQLRVRVARVRGDRRSGDASPRGASSLHDQHDGLRRREREPCVWRRRIIPRRRVQRG